MDLPEYVRLKMAEKKLTAVDIEKRSKKKITDGHVAYILAGKSKNPTLKILLGLAAGLGVDPVEVFQVAAGVKIQPQMTVDAFMRILEKIVDNKEFIRVVEILSKQKPAKIKALLRTLEEKEGA